MGGEWEIVQLGLHCSKIGSGATPRGGKSVYLDSGETCLVRSQNIHNEGFVADGLAYINDEAADQLKNVQVEPNDVLLNITGDSVARVCLMDPKLLPARVSQHVAIIRPIPKSFDARFVRYFLSARSSQEHLLTIASAGATRNALTKSMIEGLEIPRPDLVEQRRIADILSALDDKIELNRSINRTLEAMAQAIFKSWFVDFDPVKAKIAARESGDDPTRAAMAVISGKSDAEFDTFQQQDPKNYQRLHDTAEAFPDALVDSELGLIPAGWGVEPLDKVADYLNGLALQKFPPESESEWLPVIKIAQLKKGDSEGADRASATIKPEYIVDDGDVIFSWSGSLEVEIWCGGKGALNQHLFKVTSEDYPKWFYLYWTKHHLAQFKQIAADKAVTMGHIKRGHLSDALCVVPDEDFLRIVDSEFERLISKQVGLRIETKALSELRDTLLPKLLSGEIKLI